MAKIKWGSLVVDGRGKIGGHVLSKNRSGAIIRTKVTPVNPQSTYQLGVRNLFTTLSQAWRGLSESARIAWNAAVGDFQSTDIFGDLKNPTGFNLHQKLNNNLVNVGESVITSPPLPEAVESHVIESITAASGAGTLEVVYAPVIGADSAVKVFATAPLSPGKFFVKSRFRQIGVMQAADVTPFALATFYDARFGSVGAEGQKIFVKFVPVNKTTGQAGTASQASTLVAV